MIISTASDMSVRIWSITGSFLGILGQKSGWNSLENVFGFLSKKVRKEIEASNLTKEVDDCGLSSFHMSKDEVVLMLRSKLHSLSQKRSSFKAPFDLSLYVMPLNWEAL